MGLVVVFSNPYDLMRSREFHHLSAPVTVRGWLDQQGISEFPAPTYCLFNGQPLLRSDWPTAVIGEADQVAFCALPHGGGGGGGGGKQILMAVAMIAIVIAAPEIAGAIAPEWAAAAEATGAAFSDKLAFAAVKGAVVLGGSLAVNAVFGAPKPAMPSFNWGSVGGAPPAPSPTYALTPQGNQARLGQPVPEAFGRNMIVPDLAADPYQEYAGNEQFLYQLHCLGVGEYEVEAIRIEDTPIASFEEITTELVPPGGSVTLFDPYVVTAAEVAGQEARGPNQLAAGEDGWLGPFMASPPGEIATHLGIDVVFGRGLYYANNDGTLSSKSASWTVEARPVDDDGVATGAWIVLGSETHSAATNTAIRLSYKYALAAPGRYEVRCKRTTNNDQDSRTGHEMRWGQLRAYVQAAANYGDVTLLAIKARASDNLSQRSSRLVNVIATRKLPLFDRVAGTWSAAVATRSVAAAASYILRASNGANQPDSRIDLAALWALQDTWTARGDHFDGVFDSQTTAWDALSRVLRVGRAAPFQQGGVVRVVRDEPRELPVALFNSRNIVKGSFALDYDLPSEETADAVEVEYWDSRFWRPETVVAAMVDGVIRPLSAAEVNGWDGVIARTQLFGVTVKAHAEREACFLVACNIWRRRKPSWRTELDGLVLSYGDVVAVSHPMPSWGQGGEVVDWDPVNMILELSEPPRWTDGQAHYLALRQRDGSIHPTLVEVQPDPGGDPYKVLALAPPPFTLDTEGDRERTYYAFGPADAWAKPVRVRALVPRGRQVEILAVVEDDRVHVN